MSRRLIGCRRHLSTVALLLAFVALAGSALPVDALYQHPGFELWTAFLLVSIVILVVALLRWGS